MDLPDPNTSFRLYHPATTGVARNFDWVKSKWKKIVTTVW